VSWVGLWHGLIARNTFGLAVRTFAENSLTPMARITCRAAHELGRHRRPRRQQLSSELLVLEVVRQTDVPVLTSSCYALRLQVVAPKTRSSRISRS
jgi:hypothetical protein